MSPGRVALGLLLVGLVGAFVAFDLQRFLSLDLLQASHAALVAYRDAYPMLVSALYGLAYVGVTGLSLPGATVLTLAGGALFGLFWGTVLVSFASTLGATLAFLSARFLFRGAVQRRFGERLGTLDAGMAREGAYYLFGLRLVPLFPFFVINLAMGLTAIPARTFYWVSQLGMLPGTLVYVNAGTQLGKLESLSDMLSPGLLLAFALLGLFPLLARRLADGLKVRRIYAGWKPPRRFERNLVVIGAGAAGLVAAYVAATLRARVTLVEKRRMGGDCLNAGCVPSKALIRAAKLLRQCRRAPEYGLGRVEADFEFAAVMERVWNVIQSVAPHDSAERYMQLGVEVIEGEARLVSPWQVVVKTAETERTLTTRAIVIAAGARPWVPPIPGLTEAGYLTSETLWELRELPRRLLVLGGGPMGCELAQAFARFGSQVIVVESQTRLLMREDTEVSDWIAARLREEGVDVLFQHRVCRVTQEEAGCCLWVEHEGRGHRIYGDRLLVAAGRLANTEGYGLEALGIAPAAAGTVETDAYLRTLYPNIYACGDVAGPFQLTHAAAHQAWHAAVNALIGPLRLFRVDYSVMPVVTFTDPELARVGLNEREAIEQGIAYELTCYRLDDLDRAIIDGDAQGFVKVLTVPGRDRILGATIVGERAGDLIAEYALAIRHGIGLNKILGTVHAYPTFSEASRNAAGVWKRAHAPAAWLAWAERFHAWRRHEFR